VIVNGDAPCALVRNVISNDIFAVTGLDNLHLSAQDIKVYPIPVSAELIIEGANEGTGIEIYDIIGQLLYSGVITQNIEKINTEYLSPGTYLLELSTPGAGKVIKKITK